MKARQVSAQFAAYVWFTNQVEESPTTREEAIAFTRTNWRLFLPCASEGLGRLLLRIARGRNRQQRRNNVARPFRGTRADALAG